MWSIMQGQWLRDCKDPGIENEVRQLLRLSRALLYMDDPHMERPEGFLQESVIEHESKAMVDAR